MDILLRITFASGCRSVDLELARCWLVEQLHFLAALAVIGHADAIQPTSTFRVAALDYANAE
ncbi:MULTISPECIES: hypothetical protein [Kitasatospora]|uniref:Uncharacterized protein n=1 Tax=Kitasatospora setae (strain ATCC 33774 / DSM 43861 / JCM 3304 / KCC A-0304 / NBRC 14216 / KM-6054) TaxID=452652 RepID=E4NHL0_KITSK|nr:MULTISPECIES: hypothetical protein [Kitasatospora]BAJ30990.1 hypothetical protein KSE_52140 [Kitasatospora setae KM-6054]